MSQEPEKQIEKQLREHADTRRAAADGHTELHPATRAMLQGEVARTYGSQPVVPTERQLKPWWAYWPGLLFASCCVLLLAVFTIRPPRQDTVDLARTAESPPAESAVGTAFPPATPAPAATTFDAVAAPSAQSLALQVTDPQPEMAAFGAERKALELQKATTAGSAPLGRMQTLKDEAAQTTTAFAPAAPPTISAPAPSLAAIPRPAMRTGAMSAKTEAEMVVQTTPVPAPAQPATPPAAAPATMLLQDSIAATAKAKVAAMAGTATTAQSDDFNLDIANPNAGQLFEQSPPRSGMRRNFQSPASPEVLEQFRVQQNGAELRFLDSDGSVYVGNLVTAASEARRGQETKDAYQERSGVKTKELTDTSAARGMLMEAESAYYFRATGMNRSLNQPVVIDGTFKNSVTLMLKADSNRLDAAKKSLPSGTNHPQLLIQGRAVVGDRQELIINAVPVNR